MSASGILCLGHHWGDATSRYTMSSLREHNIQVYCHSWGNTTSRYTMSSLREHSSTHVVRIVRKSDICECQPVWWENNTRGVSCELIGRVKLNHANLTGCKELFRSDDGKTCILYHPWGNTAVCVCMSVRVCMCVRVCACVKILLLIINQYLIAMYMLWAAVFTCVVMCCVRSAYDFIPKPHPIGLGWE